MTDFDIRLLLAVAAEAAGMIAIAWIYACYCYPTKSAWAKTRADPPSVKKVNEAASGAATF
jgi:hypothetical protein